MKNRLSENLRREKGTALLTAMLIMGVLIAISIALSSLVMREVRVTKDLMDAGKAFYAAESGVEEALYFLNHELPGWQTSEEGMENRPVSTEGGTFKYEVKNQCNTYPCIDKEYKVEGVDDMKAFYGVMKLNESVLIPLFVVDAGNIRSVENFTVEFWADFNPNDDLNKTGNISGWDVLRWKVFGMKQENNNNYITESISDFMPLAKTTSEEFSSAAMPSWFGTIKCSEKDQDLDENGDPVRITDGIECRDYDVLSYDPSSGNDECDNASLWARDYYASTGLDIKNTGCKKIELFVHERLATESPNADGYTGLNYLSLTNIVNPAMFKNYDNKEDLAKLYFRVETYEDNTVREVAEIISDGYAGNSKQSIKVMKRRDSYMPVFNFSIYSTYGSTGGQEQYYFMNDPKGVNNFQIGS